MDGVLNRCEGEIGLTTCTAPPSERRDFPLWPRRDLGRKRIDAAQGAENVDRLAGVKSGPMKVVAALTVGTLRHPAFDCGGKFPCGAVEPQNVALFVG
jgi:hypothetical protein